jgi:hypothetical protein
MSISGVPGPTQPQLIEIPSSCVRIRDSAYDRRADIIQIVFSPNCQLAWIGEEAFSFCSSLISICIPASVSVLGFRCFGHCTALREVTFEPGSALSKIGPCSFSRCAALSTVALPPDAGFSVLSSGLFWGCSSLPSVWVPSSVDEIDSVCFHDCARLTEISFQSPCKVRRFGSESMAGMTSLRSFCVPASVEEIYPRCFVGANRLVQVTFEPNSHCRRVCEYAFASCNALTTICFPGSLEELERKVLKGSPAIRTLVFESPSKLRELDSLPVAELASLDIPDSVEKVNLDFTREKGRHLVVTFGIESRLVSVSFCEWRSGPPRARVFARYSERFLKRFRDKRELDPARYRTWATWHQH